MGLIGVLPSAFEAMAGLPTGHGCITSVLLEPQDVSRSRLTLSVTTGSMVEFALSGRPGWVKASPSFRGRRGVCTHTWWRWVRAEPGAVPSVNREEAP